MEIKKLVNKSLSIQVADSLEKQIANGTWKVGSKIPSESTLMELFGVSRNTLREAIRFLVIAGVVDVRPGDGTYIKTESVFNASMKKRLEHEKLSNILETRIILEPQLIELAADRQTEQELDSLKMYHAKLLDSYSSSLDEYIEADTTFHRHLAKMCHNSLLEDLYRAISEYFPQYVMENYSTFCEGHHNLFLHTDLIHAMVSGDSIKAREITREMIELEMQMLLLSAPQCRPEPVLF